MRTSSLIVSALAAATIAASSHQDGEFKLAVPLRGGLRGGHPVVKRQDNDDKDEKTDAKTSEKTDAKTSDKTSEKSDKTSEKTEATATSESDAKTTSKETGKPKITDETTSSESMPTLSSKSTKSIPTPMVTVPSMDNNPYMTQSKLPEGTVFIAVGAILGGLALAVIGWRMFTAMSLKRSLKRSDSAGPLMSAVPNMDDGKGMFYPGDPSRAGEYAATQSTDNLNRSRNPTNTQLFFSPTAEVMSSANSNVTAQPHHSMNSVYGTPSMTGNNGQRSSVYLPAGYYTPGNNPGTTGSMTSRTTRNFSMARESMYGGVAPSVRTSFGGGQRNVSGADQPQQRAPSAYLDDLLAHDDH